MARSQHPTASSPRSVVASSSPSRRLHPRAHPGARSVQRRRARSRPAGVAFEQQRELGADQIEGAADALLLGAGGEQRPLRPGHVEPRELRRDPRPARPSASRAPERLGEEGGARPAEQEIAPARRRRRGSFGVPHLEREIVEAPGHLRIARREPSGVIEVAARLDRGARAAGRDRPGAPAARGCRGRRGTPPRAGGWRRRPARPPRAGRRRASSRAPASSGFCRTASSRVRSAGTRRPSRR